MKDSRKNIRNTLFIVAYKLALDVVYTFFVTPRWGYLGFVKNFSTYRCVTSILLILVFNELFISRIICSKEKSRLIIYCLFLTSFVPMMTYYTCTGFEINLCVLQIIYWTVFLLSYCVNTNTKLSIKITRQIRENQRNWIFFAIYVLMASVAIFIWLYYAKGRIIIDIWNIYEIREIASEYSMPTILTYAFAATRLVFPIYIVYFLDNKKKFLFITSLIIQVILFFSDGSKSALFVIIAALLGYYFYDSNKKEEYLPLLFALLPAFSMIEVLVTKTYVLIDRIIRRVFFVPQRLHVLYYSFFKDNVKDFYRQGILGKLGFDSPYSTSIPVIIGANTSIGAEQYANNGLFSDAFCNLGVAGVFIAPIFIVLYLRLFDQCSKGLKEPYTLVAMITLTLNFMSSSFFTVLLTHGALMLCIVLYCFPRKKNQH